MTHPLVKGYAYGACRLLGHSWHIVPSDWTPMYGEAMTSRCERCNVERRDSVNRFTGAIESRRYVATPKGYYFHSNEDGVEAPTRADFRVAWLEGVISESRKRRKAS